MEDAVKKRREYVRKRRRAQLLGAGTILVGAGALVVPGTCMIAGTHSVWPQPTFCTNVIPAATAMYILLRTAFRSLQHTTAAVAEAARCYVPPVSQQVAALPDEEVLVRGSEQPSTTSDELLRAAQAGAQTQAEELLRAGT
jgi:hypothetical protein